MTKSVAVVGLGGIGMLYDLEVPGSVLSHAGAFSKHPDFDLVGAVEPKGSLREIFSKRYNSLAFSTIHGLLSHCSPEVIVVASPTHTHRMVIGEVLERHKPELILCEKPLAYAATDAEEIVALCQSLGVKLFVNYIRRADPGVIKVKSRLLSGEIELPCKAVVWYSKGLLHNGSHFLDLMTFWFGPLQSVKLISAGRSLGLDDAEPDFQATFEQCAAIFCAANEENFSHYTVEVVASNGRLRVEQDGGINWQAAAKSSGLDGYRRLQESVEAIERDARRYQYHVAEQLSAALKLKPNTLCADDEGLGVINWIQTVLKKRTEILGI
jgi:predicted dehydrogenase